MPRTLNDLLRLLRESPGQLTPGEWRFLRRHLQRQDPGALYAEIRDEAARRRRQVSRSGRDIGELPAVADPERKAQALADLRTWCETYFRHRFRLAWSSTHLAVLQALQTVITQGGRYALAVERGFGKTSLLEVAALWAVCKGLHGFVQLIGSSKGHAVEMLASIRAELEDNDLLAADFPEVCYPIQCLDGIANRAAGQLYQGRRTKIGITKEELILPTIPGSPASGAIIRVTGLTGRIRGRKSRLIRPSLVLLDDPQTEASARSVSQTDKREETIDQAVLGLAGPDKEIAVLLTGTVICQGDLMHRFLDPARHQGWIQQRYRMILSFPTNMQLWQQYWQIRSDELRAGGDGSQSTAFYRDRRALMDEGGQVSWPERMKPGEISGLQSAMNLYFALGPAFSAEYQNAPEERRLGAANQLDVERLGRQTLALARGVVPLRCQRLTAFVDIQQRLLFWLVAAWSDDFTGHVLDYGAWPEQPGRYFRADNAQVTLARKAPGAGPEAALLRGLEHLTGQLLNHQYRREDGLMLSVELALIDAGASTDTVFTFCRRLPLPQRSSVLPSRGLGISAKSRPMHEFARREGERHGLNWIIKPAPASRRAYRHLLFDANWWKSFVSARLQQQPGDAGALTVFDASSDPLRDLLLEHWTAEYAEETAGRQRVLQEWQLRPGRRENHWWDCLVGAAVAASVLGCALPAVDGPARTQRPRVRWSAIQRDRRQGRPA